MWYAERVTRLEEHLSTENAQLRVQNIALQEDLVRLHHQMLLLKKHAFGRSSEKLGSGHDERQEVLFPSPGVSEPGESEETTIVKTHTRAANRGRKPLPKDLPRERIEYEPEERSCSCCGREREKIGEEISEELDYVPAHFVVREHVRIKRACRTCQNAVVSGTLPPGVQVIEGARPGAGLLAHIAVSKFCDHLPLFRQEMIYLRQDIEIPRQRMSDWLGASVELLMPIYNELFRYLLSKTYLQADETEIKVRDPELKGRLFTGWLWAFHSPPDAVAFHYAPTRASEVPRQILSSYTGFLQTDKYAGYNAVLVPGNVRRLACLAHVRRKFVEAQHAAKRECSVILKHIAELYRVEREIKKSSLEERQRKRWKHARPRLRKLKKYLLACRERLLPKHPLAQAVEYTLTQWREVCRYVLLPAADIDSNAVERQIRPIALGRKNYLFAGSHAGAVRAAVMYSLIQSCKLNRVNPFDYLTDVLRQVHTLPASRLPELLPHNWANHKHA